MSSSEESSARQRKNPERSASDKLLAVRKMSAANKQETALPTAYEEGDDEIVRMNIEAWAADREQTLRHLRAFFMKIGSFLVLLGVVCYIPALMVRGHARPILLPSNMAGKMSTLGDMMFPCAAFGISVGLTVMQFSGYDLDTGANERHGTFSCLTVGEVAFWLSALTGAMFGLLIAPHAGLGVTGLGCLYFLLNKKKILTNHPRVPRVTMMCCIVSMYSLSIGWMTDYMWILTVDQPGWLSGMGLSTVWMAWLLGTFSMWPAWAGAENGSYALMRTSFNYYVAAGFQELCLSQAAPRFFVSSFGAGSTDFAALLQGLLWIAVGAGATRWFEKGKRRAIHMMNDGRRLPDSAFISELAAPRRIKTGDRFDFHDAEKRIWMKGTVSKDMGDSMRLKLVDTGQAVHVPGTGSQLTGEEVHRKAVGMMSRVPGELLTIEVKKDTPLVSC